MYAHNSIWARPRSATTKYFSVFMVDLGNREWERMWVWLCNSCHGRILVMTFLFSSSLSPYHFNFGNAATWCSGPRTRAATTNAENSDDTEEEQNRPLQNVPLWHVDYFELKVIKTQSRKTFTCPITTKRSLDRGSGPERELLPQTTFIQTTYLKRANILITNLNNPPPLWSLRPLPIP